MSDQPGFLQHHGYRNLFAFQKAEVIYDLTYHFCERFLRKGDRTIDQMVQAARSGKQNIIEGAKASATSTEMEIKLTNVARASLEELLADYEDFLRVRNFAKWDKNSKEALAVRKLPQKHEESYPTYKHIWETKPPEAVANVALCLINQANYLLDRHVRRLEQNFLKHGGVREAMTRARLARRANSR